MLLNYYCEDYEFCHLNLDKKRWIRLIKYKSLFHSNKTFNSLEIFNSKLFKKNTKLVLIFGEMIYQSKHKQFDINSFWFFLYHQVYFSQLLNIPIFFKSFNSHQVVPKSLLVYMIHSAQFIKWKRYNIIHSNEIIEILFLCLWLKNLKLFMDWMRKYFETTNLKKHRKLFLLLNLLIGKLVWNYNLFLQLKGLRVILRGKFSKAGSVRKTRKYIRRGKCSYTTKKIGLVTQTNIIRTLTGVFAIKFEVFFKKWCLL